MNARTGSDSKQADWKKISERIQELQWQGTGYPSPFKEQEELRRLETAYALHSMCTLT